MCRFRAVQVAAASILLASLAWASPASMDDATLARLLAAGQLWATVKYFHPGLSEADPARWDRTLLDSLPAVRAAETGEAFRVAVTEMLRPLGDPVTRVEDARPDQWASLGFASLEERDGILLVTSGDTGRDPLDAAEAMRRMRLPSTRAVVFDLRPGAVHPWLWAPPVFANPLPYPAHSFRVHAGLVSYRGEEGSPFFSGMVTRAAPVQRPAVDATDKTVVFLVRSSEQVPPIAVALQDAGLGYLIAEQPVDDRGIARHGYARHYRLSLTDGLVAHVRTSIMLHPDGTVGLVADRVVSPDDALAVAMAAARGEVPRGARPPASPRYTTKATERPYDESPYPDESLRVLAAFRTWAVFEWFSPYRELMDRNWSDVLRESLPRIVAARDAREYHLAIADFVAHVDDTHSTVSSSVLDAWRGVAGPAVVLRAIEGQPTITAVTDPSAKASGVSVGDVVVSVDGESAVERLARLGRYISASTPQARLRDAVGMLLSGPDGSEARVLVAGADGTRRSVTLERRAAFQSNAWWRPQGAPAYTRLPGNIGYIDLRVLGVHEVDGAFRALGGVGGLVLEMRGYPNGTAAALAERLADKPSLRPPDMYLRVLFEPGTETRQRFPGSEIRLARVAPFLRRGRTVMLLDDRAQSQSEFLATRVREACGAVFIGSPTAGANGEGSYFTVPGGLTIGMTAIGVLGPEGRQLQRVGLMPDIEAHPTLAGVRAGRDEILERALAYLSSEPR